MPETLAGRQLYFGKDVGFEAQLTAIWKKITRSGHKKKG
jgi:hypothetical protein